MTSPLWKLYDWPILTQSKRWLIWLTYEALVPVSPNAPHALRMYVPINDIHTGYRFTLLIFMLGCCKENFTQKYVDNVMQESIDVSYWRQAKCTFKRSFHRCQIWVAENLNRPVPYATILIEFWQKPFPYHTIIWLRFKNHDPPKPKTQCTGNCIVVNWMREAGQGQHMPNSEA